MIGNPVLFASGLAAVLSLALVPGARAAAAAAGLFDAPGPLKIHSAPIPRLGGAGLILAFLLATTAAPHPSAHPGLLLAALLLVWITGMVDDIRSLPASLRLLLQAAAGLLVHRAGLAVLPVAPFPLDALATALAVIACINAFNFLDGADGLAAGTAVIAGIGFALLPGGGSAAGAALAGACAGFLLYNFPPARVFMGDSGSTGIGLILAICALQAGARPPLALERIAAAVLILALPLADLAAAVLRRLSHRRSLFAGDRSHFYDVLIRRGWHPRPVALFTYAVQLVLTAAALAVASAWGTGK